MEGNEPCTGILCHWSICYRRWYYPGVYLYGSVLLGEEILLSMQSNEPYYYSCYSPQVPNGLTDCTYIICMKSHHGNRGLKIHKAQFLRFKIQSPRKGCPLVIRDKSSSTVGRTMKQFIAIYVHQYLQLISTLDYCCFLFRWQYTNILRYLL